MRKLRLSGYSVLELIVVMAAVSTLISGIIYAKVLYDKKLLIRNVFSDILFLRICVDEKFQTWRDYSNINDKIIATGVCLPNRMINQNEDGIKSPFAQYGYLVSPERKGRAYVIDVVNLPSEFCNEIGVRSLIEFGVSSSTSIHINGRLITRADHTSEACMVNGNKISMLFGA